MSPARASAAARADLPVDKSKPAVRLRALRDPAPERTRRARVFETLRSTNALGRVGGMAVIALFLSVFGIVVFQALLVQGQARLDDLNGQIAKQQQQSTELELQLAQLSSPDRIVGTARSRLGMVDSSGVVYLQAGPSDDAAATYTPPPAPATTPKRTTTTTAPRSTPTTVAHTTPTSSAATTPTTAARTPTP